MTSNQDFDEFLTNASAEAARKDEYEQTTTRLYADYDRAVEHYNPLPRYTDRDAAVEAMLQREAAEVIRGHIIEGLRIAGREITADIEEIIEIEVKSIVKMAAMQEALVQSKILTALAVYEYTVTRATDPDVAQLIDSKKQLIADMMILDEYEADSSWIAFANGVIPGPQFDPNTETDQPYLITSLQKLANKDIESDPKHLLLDQLTELIYVQLSKEKDGISVKEDALSLAALVMTSGIVRKNAYEREAEVTQYCRDLSIDQSVISEIMALLETQFPTQK